MANHSPAAASVPQPSLQTKERRKNGKRLERKKEKQWKRKKNGRKRGRIKEKEAMVSQI